MPVNLSFFRDYDIRGVYPSEINENVFYLLGWSVGQVLKPSKVAIGRDARLSSDSLFEYLAAGLKTVGTKVIDLGGITTPLCFWYSRRHKIDALMITASHNPKNENGLKIYSRRWGPLDNVAGMKRIKDKFVRLCSDPEIKLAVIDPPEKRNVLSAYQEFLLHCCQLKRRRRKLKVAIDFSGGMSALVLIPILEKLRINFVTLNQTPNGNFPAHSPNPLDEASQRDIKLLIRSGRFDFGAIFDGDGDRVVFLDSRGDVLETTLVFALLADFYLAAGGRSPRLVITVSLGRVIKEIAARHGARVFVSKVGRTYVQRTMRNRRALLGAEKTGHYFFKDFYFGDSGVLTFLKVYQLLSEKDKPLAKLIKPYQKYITCPEINLALAGDESGILAKVQQVFGGGKVSRLDGLSVEFDDWWFNLRRSKTENLWRLNLEGQDLAALEKARDKIVQAIQN